MKKHVDNLIVGGGLAGTWLAFRFFQMNKRFALIDKPGLSISSSVAAGIINPLLPLRQKKSYKADLIYPDLGKKYQQIEDLIRRKVFYDTPVCYIVDDQKTLNDWSALAGTDPFKEYIIIRDEELSTDIESPFGYLEIRHSGRVDIMAMLDGFRSVVSEPDYYLDMEFDAGKLIISEEGVIYEDLTADNVIFCQGAAMESNPFTSGLKLKPAKGEVLSCNSTNTIKSDKIILNGVFMLPLGDGLFRTGSNFEWNELDYLPTEKAKLDILRRLGSWYKGDCRVTDHRAGIRPSSLDRRPILGKIPGHDRMYVFNGLGSKGAALSPYYSDMLSKHIYNISCIDPEADISRFFK